MKITRRQLRQIINEEANSITEARDEGVDRFSIVFEAQDKVFQAIKTLQKVKDPNVTALGRILSRTVDSVPTVAGKDTAVLKAELQKLVRYINSIQG